MCHNSSTWQVVNGRDVMWVHMGIHLYHSQLITWTNYSTNYVILCILNITLSISISLLHEYFSLQAKLVRYIERSKSNKNLILVVIFFVNMSQNWNQYMHMTWLFHLLFIKEIKITYLVFFLRCNLLNPSLLKHPQTIAQK